MQLPTGGEPVQAPVPPLLGRYGLTAQHAVDRAPLSALLQAERSEDDRSAVDKYTAVLQEPEAWMYTLAWANAKAKRERCERGETKWIVGTDSTGETVS